ncbi:hypothetical protein DSO57_1021053 [Entomophthora muscae]|uniref:Uncharacterized protein n=2 Tax=Entomophthora muscae TaxID=34485 RepID=A0ACC2SGK7_9FUNG|nr:hypothetical protein DSO57_1019430 [Entomophthora muscae]KAJ9061409.1 hypothetical protein DSO57_1021053 [Entomophthora muscae]
MRFTSAKLLAIAMVAPVLGSNVLHCFGVDIPFDVTQKICHIFEGAFKQDGGCVMTSATICVAASKLCKVLGSKTATCT